MTYVEQPAETFPEGIELSGKVKAPYLKVDFDLVLTRA